jgi:uncharacterized protein (DUF4213/DUF364 family)
LKYFDFSGGAILREVAEQLRLALGDKMDTLTIERAVIGLFFTGVKLNTGQGGLCFTPIKNIPEAVCCPSSARAMPNSGQLKGEKVTALLDKMFLGNPLRKALGIATLNALSSVYWDNNPSVNYAFQRRVDPLDGAIIPDDAHVVVMGALAPYLKMLKMRGKEFTILELDPATLKPDELDFYVPAERAPEIIPRADWLIITGTTLINDTLDEILSLIKPGAHVIVVGPTASMLPDAFFRRGVKSLGGIIVTKADELLDIISEAGSGYHFFGKFADRVVFREKL